MSRRLEDSATVPKAATDTLNLALAGHSQTAHWMTFSLSTCPLTGCGRLVARVAIPTDQSVSEVLEELRGAALRWSRIDDKTSRRRYLVAQ
jgi:hypothetical protein